MTENPAGRVGRMAGIPLIVAALALIAAALVEFATGDLRGDPDNPADSIAFLRAAPEFYGYSGAAFIVGGATLVAGVVGVATVVRQGVLSNAYLAACCFGGLAGGFLTVAGVMRLNATGTAVYIADLDDGWGESAYLAVQLAGNQGLLATGMLGAAGWLVATALVGMRRRLPALLAIGVLPAGILLILAFDVVAPAAGIADSFFVLYILAIIVGIPAGLLAVGILMLVPGGRARLGSKPAPTT